MERGALGGLTANAKWRDYQPEWKAVNFFGGGAVTTQPNRGTDGTLTGRYRKDRITGLVLVQIELVMGTVANGLDLGTIASFYEWSLPYPAIRTGGDLPIGKGLAKLASTASPQFTQPLSPTLADACDPAQPWGKGGGEDNYVQAFAQRLLAAGIGGDANSPVFTSGVTNVTVTHGLGAISGFVPAVYDIYPVLTNSPSTNPRSVFVSNITATTFQLNVGVASTTTPPTYAWNIRAEPNGTGGILVNAGSPFPWGEGASIGLQCLYEARR